MIWGRGMSACAAGVVGRSAGAGVILVTMVVAVLVVWESWGGVDMIIL